MSSNSPTRCRVGDATKPHPANYQTGTASLLTIDLAADANMCWCLGVNGLLFSYSGGTFTGGTVTIASGPNSGALVTRLSFDTASAGLAPVPYPKPLKFKLGDMVRITLSSGGASVVGKLNLTDHWKESDMDPAF